MLKLSSATELILLAQDRLKMRKKELRVQNWFREIFINFKSFHLFKGYWPSLTYSLFSVSQSPCQATCKSVNQPLSQSVSQLVNQSVSQSISLCYNAGKNAWGEKGCYRSSYDYDQEVSQQIKMKKSESKGIDWGKEKETK